MIWLKWSWRDLRSRWVQVAAIAIVIAVGTGLFSGLRSMNVWRGLSNEASYAVANTFDLRVELSEGNLVDRGTLLRVLSDVDTGSVAVAEERLILPTQVSIETAAETILVPGRIVGVDVANGGPHVNSLHPQVGRNLTEADAESNVVTLEHNFAKFYDLPPQGSALLAGAEQVEYVGQSLAPEYFFVVTPEGGILAQANFAAVFTSIETAQQLTGMERKVNDLVLRLEPGADEDLLYDSMSERFGQIGGTVSRRLDDPSIRLMIEDVEGDQQFNTVLAIAIFGGAVFAAFNLTSRIVDSQRREIGVAMALGVPTRLVALRPLLFSAQVALLGVIFGIAMGIGVAEALGSYLSDFLPLPAWRTPFQFGVFAAAGAIGFLVPFLATAIPVWNGVRVAPIEAIRTGHLADRAGGMPKLLSMVRIPGQTLRQIPFRNVARAPRRTLLTALAIGAIVAVMVTVLGMLDSFIETIDRVGTATAGTSPDRVEIAFDTVYPTDSPLVENILDSPSAGSTETLFRTGGLLSHGEEAFEVLVEFIDYESDLWLPTIVDGSFDASGPGVVIAEKAAEDLGVGPGDTVTLSHPTVSSDGVFSLAQSELEVVGLHANPLRIGTFVDCRHCGSLGVADMTNVVLAMPAPGVEVDTLKQEMFGRPGVASVQKATASSEVFQDQFEQYTGILGFILAFVVLLALLIAYNTASINMDERRREHATMLAYGLPARTILGMAMTESAVLGLIATAFGMVGGYLMLQWVANVLMPNAFPDLGLQIVFNPASLVTVIALSVIAVAVAPVFTIFRLRKTDIPSTLRVME
ncbi:MAG: FtsX-like permease family protein [Dehalococcoidia bacterium]|nr:FtsX-like permease family protein [Dehalococcoidia bacterium]